MRAPPADLMSARLRFAASTLAATLLLTLALPPCTRAQKATEPHTGKASHPAGQHDATTHHSFADAEGWARVFDDPSRDEWQRPKDVVSALGLRPGMAVADLGAGTGYFSRYLCDAVGGTGSVFAAETEPNLLIHLRKRAEQEHLDVLTPVLASFDNPRLPRASVDVVLVVDTFHHIDDRLTYFRRLQRTLKPGGRVAVIDWQKRELPVGPPSEHKLAREQVLEEMTAAGYQLAGEPQFLPYQYFLIFRVP